jgi:hypothetical protein
MLTSESEIMLLIDEQDQRWSAPGQVAAHRTLRMWILALGYLAWGCVVLFACSWGVYSQLSTHSSTPRCVPSSGRADECVTSLPDLSLVREMNVAMTACGDNLREDAIISIKSWMLHRAPGLVLHFYLLLAHDPPIAEQRDAFQAVFSLWPVPDRGEGFTVTYLDVGDLPPNLAAHIHMFKRCSGVRLFIEHLLPRDMEAVVYADADTLVVGDVRRLWAEFQTHPRDAVFGASWEANGESTRSWYQETDRGFPYPKPWGVNAGVLLINLARLRSMARQGAPWDERVAAAIAKYGPRLELGDQDVLNALFAEDPSLWRAMPCGFNFRTGCFTELPAHPRGLTVAHGNNGFFHQGKTLGNGRVNHMAGIHTFYANFWRWPSSNSSENMHNPLE